VGGGCTSTAARACRRLALAPAWGTFGDQLLEYANEIAAGAGLETSTFFTLYFLLTGFHLLHVLLGMVILAIVLRGAEIGAVETGTSFWHMVDLVWIVMFPIIYLVR
jgi:nitric oxide reductase NorE protein